MFDAQGPDGSGVRAENGSDLTVTNSTFDSGRGDDGSAIVVRNGNLTVDGATFTNNAATNDGTIHCWQGADCIVRNSLFQGNDADRGAVAWIDGPGNAVFEGNTVCDSAGNFGALDLENTTISIQRSVFYDNTGLSGPLILVDNYATANLQNNHFVGTDSSGAVMSSRSRATRPR